MGLFEKRGRKVLSYFPSLTNYLLTVYHNTMFKINYKRVFSIVILIVNMFFLLFTFIFFVVAQAIDLFEGDPFATAPLAVITFFIFLLGIPVIFIFHVFEFIKINKGKNITVIPILTLLLFILLMLTNTFDYINFY